MGIIQPRGTLLLKKPGRMPLELSLRLQGCLCWMASLRVFNTPGGMQQATRVPRRSWMICVSVDVSAGCNTQLKKELENLTVAPDVRGIGSQVCLRG